ncbi:MAG: hypothetical protein KGI54_18600 [Pseudomonadota bacterium]|nr:hypothetical protein [Pseudomonadota bacterium]
MIDADYESRQFTLLEWLATQHYGFSGASEMRVIGRSFLAFSDVPQIDFWADEKLQDLCWWAVCKQIRSCAPKKRIVDHAWAFGAPSKPFEPWGFVLEPYIGLAEAEDVVNSACAKMKDWGVDVFCLAPALSAWNQNGSVRPIVAAIQLNGYSPFLRSAALWALNHLA